MKKTLSILLTLMMLVGMVAVGAVSASAEGHTHRFDKNGVCTECKVNFSEVSYEKSGNGSFGDRVYFEGADKIVVTIHSKGLTGGDQDSFEGKFYDVNDNEKTAKFVQGIEVSEKFPMLIHDFFIDDSNPLVMLVDGDYVRVSANTEFYYEFFPLYNANKTTSGGNSVYTYGGKSYQIDSGLLTGSVLSEGNMWIIVAVAVLALGGVAALFILKKKKKLVPAGGANSKDDE